ncbi:hypothetical protein AQV86_04055 [Nanohaloarchaea archaeon SG9]|nr:hypothetical protein AQV86_04055 [Nanohaloarchaea archaeon SG9]
MEWGNDVYQLAYPSGNVHLPYFEAVAERFEGEGLEPEDAHIVTVGSDLVGWWLKDRYPEAEVTTVEVNPRTSYLQNFAGDYLSRPGPGKSTDELKEFLGIDDPGTGIPNFVEDGKVPGEVLEKHREYAGRPETGFDEIPDFSEIGFAWKDFYPGVIDEIGFNTERPDNQVIGDFREQNLSGADAVYTNNVFDVVGGESFYGGIEKFLKDEAYLEMVSEPGSEQEIREQFSGLEADLNPDIDFWWKPSPKEEKEKPGYRPSVALYSPAQG